jgi:cytochrome c553
MLPGKGCEGEPARPGTAATPVAASPSPTATPAPDLFAASVRPMLAQKCAPCHEPGGKLYEKLPFDRPAVVAEHAPGMMKRLKGEDRATLEQWIATLPGKAPTSVTSP